MAIRLNQVYGALAPLTEGNFQFGLNYGSGLGVSSGQLVNTGVLSLQGDTGSLSLSAGTGIGISGLTISNTGIISASAGSGISVSGTNPLTITNTGVLSLQGDTGSLSLGAGTGIGISGLTISNTGIISASAGSGISVSGTNPLTITNTGVLSLQGDTGALSLTAGTGIGISGLTISNTGIISASAGSGISVSGTNPLTITNTGVVSLLSNSSIILSGNTGVVTVSINTANPNSWSATQTIGALTVDDAVGGTPFTPNGNTAFAFYNGGFSNYVGNGEWLGFWRDNGNYFAPLIGEQNSSFIIAFANDSATAYNGLKANSGTMAFEVEPSGAVYTGSNQNYAVPVPSGTSHGVSIRNTLDDGSGNMDIVGSFSGSGNMTIGGSFTGNEDINIGGSFTGSGNMTIAGNKGVELNNGAYGNYFWVYSEGVVGFFGNEYTTPIIDVGTNVTQQNENSNGLPAPNTSYGGGLFRLDLRTGNPSGLTGLTEAPQWYVLLQPSGTAGSGTSIFGVDVGGHVSSIHNTLDDGSGNMTIDGNLTLLKYYKSATFTTLYTTTNSYGSSFSNGGESYYNVLTNSMQVNISASTISVFSVFGEHNNGGGIGVGILLTTVPHSAGDEILLPNSTVIAYFPAISTAGNTGDSSTIQTWIASGVASIGTACYISVACGGTDYNHYVEFNQTVITFP